MPPSMFLKFSMPPPPEFGIKGVQSGILSYHRYNLQFLKMSDILKHVFCVHGIFSTNGMKSKEIEAYWRFCMHFDRHAKTFATDARRYVWRGHSSTLP
jgi:hypothetical protein